MARNATWRRTCPDYLILRIEQALEAKVYLLRETGPTGFLLKEDDVEKHYKVFLGDPHTCTCSAYKKDRELCIHVLWVLLRKFRIPKDNPVVYQLGLVEREINEVVFGALLKNEKKKAIQVKEDGAAKFPKRKIIDDEDICPICHIELKGTKTKEDLTFCKYGCGNNIHLTCMKVWAEHQKSSGEGIIKCPLCRSDFGSYKDLMKDYFKHQNRRKRDSDSDIHKGCKCKHCGITPIQGKCYRCDTCKDYFLCHTCFSSKWHSEHNFHYKTSLNSKWKQVERDQDKQLCLGLINSFPLGARAAENQSVSNTGLIRGPTWQRMSHNRKSSSERRTSQQGQEPGNSQLIDTFGVTGTRLNPALSRHSEGAFQDQDLRISDQRNSQHPFLLADRLSERPIRTPKYLPPLPHSKEKRRLHNDVLSGEHPTLSFSESNIQSRTRDKVLFKTHGCSSAESVVSRRHRIRPVSTRKNLSAEILRRKTPSEPDLRALDDIFQVSNLPVGR